MGKVNIMEQGCCADCGSSMVEVYNAEKEANILLWYRCGECGSKFIEVYEYTIKGLVEED